MRTAPAGVTAGRVIDCAGLCLAPGFVDVHTHADHLPFVDPAMGSVLRQGVTTSWWELRGLAVAVRGSPDALGPYLADLGPCFGASGTSFGDYLEAIGACRPGANVAALVGHGSLAAHVLGGGRRTADRPPSARCATRA